jgi:hypothetical protein
MKLGVMQPYLFPYIGYFQLIHAVDTFVAYDDVNYIKGGWINRNCLLVNSRKFLFTVRLDHSSPYKRINEISIKDNFETLLKTIRQSYGQAQFFPQTMPLLEKIFAVPEKNLGKFAVQSLVEISKHLGIGTEIIPSSCLDQNENLERTERLINVCKKFGTGTYINAIGGQKLYDKAEFAAHGITLNFLKTAPIVYKQIDGMFVPSLSIIDVMMFNSVQTIRRMLDQYELI